MSLYGEREVCSRCDNAEFQQAPTGSVGYWAAQRIVPVQCKRCGYVVGYGLLSALPEYSPPRSEDPGPGYRGHPYEDSSPNPQGNIFSLSQFRGRLRGLKARGMAGESGMDSWRFWWVLGIAVLVLALLLAAILVYVDNNNERLLARNVEVPSVSSVFQNNETPGSAIAESFIADFPLLITDTALSSLK